MANAVLTDRREGSNIQHGLTALLRQSIYGRLAAYDELSDAERLAVVPVMRQVVGGRAVDRTTASASQMARIETEVLTQPQNQAALRALPGQWVDRVRQVKPIEEPILDLASSASETYGLPPIVVVSCDLALETVDGPGQPQKARDVVPDEPADPAMASSTANHASLSEPAFARDNLRHEPCQAIPHVRIYARGARQPPSLPRQGPLTVDADACRRWIVDEQSRL